MRWQFGVWLAGAVVGGCTPTHRREPACPPEPPPAVVASRQSSTIAGELAGQILDATSGQPIAQAELKLEPVRRGLLADSVGSFVLDHLEPGRYVLRARKIGYALLIDTLELEPGRGLRLRLPLQRKQFDGCPGFMVIVEKKPWWKFW